MTSGVTSVEALISRSNVNNVLLLTAADHPGDAAVCRSLCRLADADEQGLIGVVFDQDPDEWLAATREALGTLPAHLGIVAVGEGTRSADTAGGPASPAGDGAPAAGASPHVRTVASAAQLTQLGVEITACLEAVAGAPSVAATALCFQSLSPLLDRSDTRSVFRFLSVLTGYVTSQGVFAHYHLDPEAHDDQTRAQLTTLFDAAVAFDDEDEPVVRSAFA